MSQRPYQSPRILRCNSPRSLIFVRLVDDNHVRPPVQQDHLLRSAVDVLAPCLGRPSLALSLAARDDLLPPERLLPTRDEEARDGPRYRHVRLELVLEDIVPRLVEGLCVVVVRIVQVKL